MEVLHTRPLALLPNKTGAWLGAVKEGDPKYEKMAGEAARTVRFTGTGCGVWPVWGTPLVGV